MAVWENIEGMDEAGGGIAGSAGSEGTDTCAEEGRTSLLYRGARRIGYRQRQSSYHVIYACAL